ncbi:MAG: 3-isopropylmalate dehydrogenase [Candidatus Dadabacteria bacterium]|nr:MAG: 3-isopropylmalate dehydrogenase [Candidatus Dadabacteria bacterium]
MAKAKIAVLGGDGIGPEITEQALRVLKAVADLCGHSFEIVRGLIGGAAFDQYGEHLPADTLKLCRTSDAVLLGAVGGPVEQRNLPRWKNCEVNSLLRLRKEFQFAINLRPLRIYPGLTRLSPLKMENLVSGVDILIVRELIGDIYFGEKYRRQENGVTAAYDLARYDKSQIQKVADFAFKAAETRNKRVISVDKANVLETSKLWRESVEELISDYSNIKLEHMFIDNCAMQLVKNPAKFDVLLTSNLFGDILSDLAAGIAGSLGLMPSASLNYNGFGLYEPAGGSAPDLAGKGIANPIGQILSIALMLRYSFGLEKEACIIEQAVEDALNTGVLTPDLAGNQQEAVTTEEFADRIIGIISDKDYRDGTD